MEIGRLNKRVDIEEVVTSIQDEGGQAFPIWGVVASVWAQIEPLSAKEFLVAQQARASVTHNIMLRYRTDVTPKNRIVYQGRVFEINGVRNLNEGNSWLIVQATETLNGAGAGDGESGSSGQS